VSDLVFLLSLPWFIMGVLALVVALNYRKKTVINLIIMELPMSNVQKDFKLGMSTTVSFSTSDVNGNSLPALTPEAASSDSAIVAVTKSGDNLTLALNAVGVGVATVDFVANQADGSKAILSVDYNVTADVLIVNDGLPVSAPAV
jgi:hypothetical protein